MKTIFHNIQDGMDIVTGFGDAAGLMDYVGTSAKIEPLVTALEETSQIAGIEVQIAQRRQMANAAVQAREESKARGDVAGFNRYDLQVRQAQQDIDDFQAQELPLIESREARRRQLLQENAVYFSPPAYEALVSDDQAASLGKSFAGKTAHQQMKVDGSYVDDWRGTGLYLLAGNAWSWRTITALGDKPAAGELTFEALSGDQRTAIDAQRETARVAALSPDERTAEAKTAQATAQAQAAALRSQEEISGTDSATALKDAQAQYQQALSQINGKYGVSLS